MTRAGNKVWVGFLLFTIILLSGLPTTTSQANEELSWLNADPFDIHVSQELTADNASPPPSCNRKKMNVMWPGDSSESRLINVCSVTFKSSELGWAYENGGRYFLRAKGGDVVAHPLSLSRPLLINNSKGLFVQTKYPGGGSNIQQVGYYSNPESFQLNRYGHYEPTRESQFHAVMNPNKPEERLRISPGIGFSPNGEWLVMESSAFRRYHIGTGEILSFGTGGTYNLGANPGTHIAISDDGRHVLITGTPNLPGSGQALIYDLSTCSSGELDDQLKRVDDCQYRDIRPYVKSKFPDYKGMLQPEFSSNNLHINARLLLNDGTRKDIAILAPDYDMGRLDYLALGDSFSSGEGDRDDIWYQPGTNGDSAITNNTGLEDFPYWKEKCHLSKRSYPFILAQHAAVQEEQFKSMACSGSTMNDITDITSDYIGRFEQLMNLLAIDNSRIKNQAIEDYVPGREAQIKFLEKYRPLVATVGIGGNDIKFANKMADCVAILAQTCRYASTDRVVIAGEMQALYLNLVNTYETLKKVSPTTQFYVISYPQLVTLGGQCDISVRLDELEQGFAYHMVDYLNATIQAAAAKVGMHYLDIEYSLSGNNLCSSAHDIAVNGLQIGNDISPAGTESRYFGIIGQESYHPNELGHQLIASKLQTYFDNQGILGGTCLQCEEGGSSLPATPSYFDTYDEPVPTYSVQLIQNTASDLYTGVSKTIKQGADFVINSPATYFAGNSTVNLTLYSDPTPLGEVSTAANGSLQATITLPENVPSGLHTLYAHGIDRNGQAVQLYEPVFVYASTDDVDGDGISNEAEPCGIFEPMGVDKDKDGVDDSCDPLIFQPTETPIAPGKSKGRPAEFAAVGRSLAGHLIRNTPLVNTLGLYPPGLMKLIEQQTLGKVAAAHVARSLPGGKPLVHVVLTGPAMLLIGSIIALWLLWRKN